ncbi:unnamed protein product [Owenia fusiformis]|uniref:Uncharacterized protein n=1 Tax=Owenia fusiformis TaxID=6347 RepID=A0A8J1T8Q4_OWEFU|nr:unnamed protein product [Owenia fusiformis]
MGTLCLICVVLVTFSSSVMETNGQTYDGDCQYRRRDCSDSYYTIRNSKDGYYRGMPIQQYTWQCDHSYNWGYSASEGAAQGSSPVLSEEQLEWLRTLGEQFNADFQPDPPSKRQVEPHVLEKKRLRGAKIPLRQRRQSLPLANRKEYRTVSALERSRFHDAIQTLKTSPLGSSNKYDTLADFHLSTFAVGAHDGAAFLTWHRVYLVLYEYALRQVDSSVSLLYWDSTLEQSLDDPSTSNMWHSSFMGNANGDVTSGPAANWLATDGNKLWRAANNCPDVLTTPGDIANIFSKTTYGQIACGTPGCQLMEQIHGKAHSYVGGQMGNVDYSPNDPIFWMHHAFIDCVWEEFRNDHQIPDPQTDYPASYGSPAHAPSALMQPFTLLGINVQNKQGLLNIFTNKIYKCAARPKCPDCGSSPYLYCDTVENRCKPFTVDRKNCTNCAYVNIDVYCSNGAPYSNVPYGLSGVYFETNGRNYNGRRQEYYYGDYDSYYTGRPNENYGRPDYSPHYVGYAPVDRPSENADGYSTYTMNAYTAQGSPCQVECVSGYRNGQANYQPCNGNTYRLDDRERYPGYAIPYEREAANLYYRPSYDEYVLPTPSPSPYFRVRCPCRRLCYDYPARY